MEGNTKSDTPHSGKPLAECSEEELVEMLANSILKLLSKADQEVLCELKKRGNPLLKYFTRLN